MIALTSVSGEAFVEASNAYIRSAGFPYAGKIRLCHEFVFKLFLPYRSRPRPHRNSPANTLQVHETWKVFAATITASITFSAAGKHLLGLIVAIVSK